MVFVFVKRLSIYGLLVVVAMGLLCGCVMDKSTRLLLVPGVTNQARASQVIAVAMPVGPETGQIDEKLTYSVGVKSSLNGVHNYGFDWGDGDYTWTSSAIATHYWQSSGIYIVRVQVKCNSEVSDWSSGRVVMIGSAILSRSPLDRPDQAVQYINPARSEIKIAIKEILPADEKDNYGDLDALREWVATNIRYKSDQDNFGARDYWQFPMETLERGSGDCEDIAILLCSLLRAYGVPAEQVYVAVGNTKGTQVYHAYLIERYSKGIWNMIEPQLDPITSAVSFTFLDWALTYDYSSDLYCFNDQYFFRGLPGVSTGIYELNVWHSFWPFFPCASTKIERQLKIEDNVEGTIQWLGTEDIVFDWSLNVYGPNGDIVLNSSGNDKKRDFGFRAKVSGIYKIEIIKRDYAPRNLRTIINPTGWKKAKS
jgi:transglutaminase-like putative cysteine protease